MKVKVIVTRIANEIREIEVKDTGAISEVIKLKKNPKVAEVDDMLYSDAIEEIENAVGLSFADDDDMYTTFGTVTCVESMDGVKVIGY